MEERILRTKLSMSRVTSQYEEAMKMNLPVDDDMKYEYKEEPFNLVLSKVAGWMAADDRSKDIGAECTGVFIDSDYIYLVIPPAQFEAVMVNFLKIQNESK